MTDVPKSPGTPPVNPISPTLGPAMIDLPERAATGEVGAPLPPLDPYLGLTLDNRYVIERQLGEGGMGVVYAGRHQVIDKRVAIKVLRRDMANDDEVNERFLQEARAASAIGNEHIVDISDFGRLPDGSTYFVMELLEGQSLSDVLAAAKGPLTVPRLCHIGKQIAEGLAAAHAAKIVHRDLKPDNIMLVDRGSEEDFVKILDFGIAKVGNATKKVTRAGSVFGTPDYLSPEQAAGAVFDIRTEVYALGVILYEMATGKVPFDADNFMGILTQHMYKAPVPIRALLPEVNVPAGLDAIVLKCLTKKPEGRYPSMDTLLADLDKVEQGVLPDAVQEMMARSGAFNVPADYFRSSGSMMAVPVPADASGGSKRWPLYAVIATLAAVLGGFGAVVIARSFEGGRPIQTQGSAAAPASLAPPAGAPFPAALGGMAGDRGAQPASVSLTAREILVSVVPSDATIARDGQPLGQSPVALYLRDGEEASLVLDHKGFKRKTVTVNSDDPKQAFTLDSIPVSVGAPARARPAAAEAAPRTAPAAIDDIGDPFAPKR